MRQKGILKTLGFLAAGLLAIPAFSAPRATMTNPAEPGTVNYIEGQVNIAGQALTENSVGTELRAGQTLTTQDGKAEILLTPGVFLRLDRNSAITMDSPDLASIHLTLDRGRALVEADQVFKENNIAIAVNGANAQVLKKGLYELDATAPYVRVFDGQARVEVNGKEMYVHGGHQLAVNDDGKLKVHGFDKKDAEKDDFYRWASLRSSYLAQANVKTAEMYVAGGPGWYGPGWYWSPWYSAYTWIPGDGIFWNPFGWGFFAPGFVGYAPYYGFAYAPVYRHFGPGYRAPVIVNRGFAGHEFHGAIGSGVRTGPAAGAIRGGGFGARGLAGGGFHGGGFHGGGFHGGGFYRGRR